MNPLLRFFFLFLIGLAMSPCLAAPVEIPCSQCPRMQRPPAPESGFWYNPLQPGTGFSLELQRKTLAGAYFGYTPQGQPLWFTFSGNLQRAGATDIHAWSVDAELYQFAGGACLGCPYSAPNAQSVTRLRIEFLQRSLARFRIAEGPWTLIQPLTYGVPAFPEFAPAVAFRVPDLEGAWVLVFDNPRADPTTRAYPVDLSGNGNPIETDSGRASYGVYGPPSISSDQAIGRLDCLPTGDRTPLCTYEDYGFFGHNQSVPRKEFLLPLGNISDSRFKGEAADGETVEGFRLDHD